MEGALYRQRSYQTGGGGGRLDLGFPPPPPPPFSFFPGGGGTVASPLPSSDPQGVRKPSEPSGSSSAASSVRLRSKASASRAASFHSRLRVFAACQAAQRASSWKLHRGGVPSEWDVQGFGGSGFFPLGLEYLLRSGRPKCILTNQGFKATTNGGQFLGRPPPLVEEWRRPKLFGGKPSLGRTDHWKPVLEQPFHFRFGLSCGVWGGWGGDGLLRWLAGWPWPPGWLVLDAFGLGVGGIGLEVWGLCWRT